MVRGNDNDREWKRKGTLYGMGENQTGERTERERERECVCEEVTKRRRDQHGHTHEDLNNDRYVRDTHKRIERENLRHRECVYVCMCVCEYVRE
jgi:hypothetical protein